MGTTDKPTTVVTVQEFVRWHGETALAEETAKRKAAEERLADAVAKTTDALRAKVLAAVDRRIEHYATDIFPEGGKSQEAKYAQLARLMLRVVRADLVTIFDEGGAE